MSKKPILEDAFILSLGLASIVKDRAADFVEFLVKEGKLAVKDRQKLRNQLASQGEKEFRMMKKVYEKSLATALKAMNVPTRKEFNALKKKVDKEVRK